MNGVRGIEREERDQMDGVRGRVTRGRGKRLMKEPLFVLFLLQVCLIGQDVKESTTLPPMMIMFNNACCNVTEALMTTVELSLSMLFSAYSAVNALKCQDYRFLSHSTRYLHEKDKHTCTESLHAASNTTRA